MMNWQTILLVEKQGGVIWITLNRPDRLNAINLPMAKELLEAVRACGGNDEVRAVVISGAGRAFCSGSDLKFDPGLLEPEKLTAEITELLNSLILGIRGIQKPVIASVKGSVSGAGFSLLLACDLAIAAANAKFNMAFIKIGVTPDLGATYFLPRHMGLKRASELFFTGEVITAQEAAEFGIVNKVVPEDDLEEATGDLATRLARGPTLAIGRTKSLINQGFLNTLEQQLVNERQVPCPP
jgi:2-(1,2-epoxy-1,2-dihydrophenyl)acetyl-CoA isomerase